MAGSLTQIFNPIGDAMDAANSILNTADKYLEKEANYRLRAISNQLEVDTNEMLLNMQKNNDYESWPGQIDDFLQEKVKAMGDKNSKYYCENGYMARNLKQMIDGQRPQLLMKAEQAKLEKEKEHDINLYQQNRENDRTSGLYSPQDMINRGKKDLDDLYQTGRITETQYNNQLDLLYSQTYTDHVINTVEGAMASGIENNMSFNKLWEEYEKANPDKIKKYGLDGLEQAVDTTTLDRKLKSQLEQNYNAKIRDIQQSNADKLSEIYAQMRAAKTWEEKLNIARRGQAALASYKGMQLSETDRTKYAAWFDLGIADATGKGGSGSGSGSNNLKTLDQLLRTEQSSFISDAINGDINANAAKVVFREYMIEHLMKGDAKDYKANTKQEANNILDEYGSKYFTEFNEKFIDTVIDQKKFTGSNAKLKKLTKDMTDHPEQYGETTIGYIYENLFDLMISNNINNLSDKEVIDMVDKWSNAAYGSKIESLIQSIPTNESGFFDYKNNKQRKEYFTQATFTGENNDVMYSDDKGVIHFKSTADQEAVEAYADNARLEIARSLGIEAKDLRMKWQKDKYGDETPIPTFTDSKGNVYHIESVVNKKGKAEDYKIVDQTGKQIASYDYDKMKKAENEKIKAAQKAGKDNSKAAALSTNKMIEERNTKEMNAADAVKKPIAANNFSQKDWDKMNGYARSKVIEGIIRDMEDGDNKTLEQYNITKEEFNKKSRQEKWNLVTGNTK